MKSQTICDLCDGSGYIKSNTMEYEGDCPDLPHPINQEVNMNKEYRRTLSTEELRDGLKKPTTTQHTPYDLQKKLDESVYCPLCGAHGSEHDEGDTPDAAYIVKCVNSHEELLQILKTAVNYLPPNYLQKHAIEAIARTEEK